MARRTRMIAHVVSLPLLARALLGCTAGVPESGGHEDDVAEVGQAARQFADPVISMNGLTVGTVRRADFLIPVVNGPLTAAAITANADVMAALGSQTPTGDPSYPTHGDEATKLLDDIYGCAAPSGTTMTVNGHVYTGGAGLGGTWATDPAGKCDATNCQPWVSACVISRLNGYGTPIEIALHGPQLNSTAADAQGFTLNEGRYWGNIFLRKGAAGYREYSACTGPGSSQAQHLGRICSASGGYCQVTVLGACADVCPGGVCPGNARSLDIWLKAPPASSCGDDVCQTGETPANCPADCTRTVQTTSNHKNGAVEVITTDGPYVYYAGYDKGASGATQIFLTRTTADKALLAAGSTPTTYTRNALPDEEVRAVDVDAVTGKLALATTAGLSIFNTANLGLQWTASGSFTTVAIDAGSVNATSAGAHQRWDLVTGAALGTTTPVLQDPIAPVLSAGDACAYYVSYKYSATQVKLYANPTGAPGCSASVATSVLWVPGISDPTPASVVPGAVIAGTGRSGTRSAAFIVRATPGSQMWVWTNRIIASAGDVEIRGMVAQGNSVVVSGRYRGIVDFSGQRPSAVSGLRRTVDDLYDGFVAAYDYMNGTLRWVRTHGGPGDDQISAAVVDGGFNIWSVGRYQGTIDFEGQYVTAQGGLLDHDGMVMTVGPFPTVDRQTLVGGDAFIAIQRPGKLFGAGANVSGQLGQGWTSVGVSTPIVAHAGYNITVAAGGRHMLAVDVNRTVRAWGDNSDGQVGPAGVGSNVTTPTITYTDFLAVDAGDKHSVGIKSDGTLWAWGNNSYGQLGDGTTASRSVAQPVPGLTGVVAVCARGNTTYALKVNGLVYAWGDGTSFTGSPSVNPTPVRMGGVNKIAKIACGQDFAMAMRSGLWVYTWGMNTHGQLGNATTGGWTAPVRISALDGAVQIVAGARHGIALKGDGTVLTWGDNTFGQLGDGTTVDRTSPIVVTGLPQEAMTIGAGAGVSLVRLSDASVWSWGLGTSGQLGVGVPTSRATPAQVFLP